MANDNPTNRRVVPVGDSTALSRGLRLKRAEEYPDVPAVYLEVAQRYTNPLLVGPPLCDELLALVQHMFTEEEASLARHIKSPLGKTAAALARADHRHVDEVRPILDRLVDEKFVLIAYGADGKKRYGLIPLLPGVFEMTLIRTSLDSLTAWHRRFAELFTALYDTGFFADYVQHPVAGVRYVPVGETIESHPQALPFDRLEEILDRHTVFAVGLCQCRMAEQIVGRGCDRPLENCIGFGDMTEYLIHKGKMRRIDKRGALAIKAEAAAAGLASFVTEIEVGKYKTGASCSCCGCCCGGLRMINQFNAPGLIAPPHFVPHLNLDLCTFCARCARACPVGAMVVDAQGKAQQHLKERCIGCGLCAAACDRQHAIQMEPVADYRQPPRTALSALVQMGPNYLRNAWSVWRKQR